MIDACDAMKRWASSDSLISRENRATGRGRSGCSATFSAMLVTNADLPIEGRAAMMIMLPGWKPPVISSSSEKPDGVPVIVWPSVDSLCQRSTSSCMISPAGRKSFWRSSRPTSSIAFSACSTMSRGAPSWLWTDAWIS